MSAGDIFLGLLAIIFPPLAVWIKSGICSFDSLINILLTILGYVPGLLHAWYVIAVHPEHDYDYEPIDDAERGGSRYYVVAGGGSSTGEGGNRQAEGRLGPRPDGYGTTHTNNRTSEPNGPSSAAPNVSNNTRPAAQQGRAATTGEGSTAARNPPTYAEAVRGDHKVQPQD